MEQAAKRFLLLSVFFSLSWNFPQKDFHLVHDKMDWPSARSYCTKHFVDLASFSDATEMDQMMKNLVDSGEHEVFVGLKREWQWAPVSKEDQREDQIKFNKFDRGQPQDIPRCAMIKPSGNWAVFGCVDRLSFICYDVNKPDKFVLGNKSLAWHDSNTYCKEHHTGLARIQTEEENEQVMSLANGTHAWIGLTLWEWSWSDGLYPKYVPWIHKRPLNTPGFGCSFLNITKQPPTISESSCAATLPFVCYGAGKRKNTVRITIKHDKDLSESAAADSVMKMVQQKLEEQGFQDVRLTWSKRPQKVNKKQQPSQESCPVIEGR